MDLNCDNLRDHYENKRDHYFDHERPEMLEFIPPDSRFILDVGCGGGGFGAFLKKYRPESEVWGVEPDPKAAQRARNRLDRVFNTAFQEGLSELGNSRFDCIVFNDVLEHTVDPEALLRVARKHLRSNGAVVASIPNILHFYQIGEILYHQDWKYREEGILDSTHLRFFTKKSIERLFTNAGYERMVVTGINPFSDIRFKIVNLLLLGRIADWKYVQFAVQAWKSNQNVVKAIDNNCEL